MTDHYFELKFIVRSCVEYSNFVVLYGGKLWWLKILVNLLQKHLADEILLNFVHSQTKNHENFVTLSSVIHFLF